MKRKYIIGLVLVAVVALIAFRLYSNKKVINDKSKSETNSTALQIPVIIDTVDFYSPSSSLKKTGTVVPFKQAVAYASSAGNITQLKFDLGTYVSAGQLLAVTDPQKTTIDIQNAVAKEKKLKNELDTYIELLAGKAATQEKVNQLRLDYTDAQNQVALLRRQLGDTRILAPVSGVVTEKKVEQGVYVNGGTEIATIVDIRKVKVQVYLTENEALQTKQGDFAHITSEVFPDKIFKGRVTYISPQGDATHSYLTEITIDNPDNNLLRSGAFVYADFSTGSIQPVMVMPREALLENTQTPTVYVVKDNKVTAKEVATGKDFGDKIEILSGLSRGETVVVSGQINLSNGTSVKITNNKSSK
jgi:RND family efflux transporter MFP subunit